MGRWYAECLAQYEASELVAVCDLDLRRAQELAEAWRVPAVYEDYEAMLDGERLDAVVVATPDRHHTGPALAALARGLHVLCEKPLATTLEDGLAIRDAAREAGREVMVNFGNRHRPRVKMLRRAVMEEDAVGEVGSVYIELNERMCKTMELAWAEESSPLWFLLSHCVDLVRYVTGLEIVEVFGYESRGALSERGVDVADTVVCVGTLSNGGRLLAGASWAYPDGFSLDIDFSVRIHGHRGLIQCQMHPHDMMLYSAGGARAMNYVYPFVDHRARRHNWWFESTRYFVHCIDAGGHPTPDVEDGLACLRVLLAVEESIHSGRPVEIRYD